MRGKIKETEMNWVTERCEEAEELLNLHDSFNFHEKIKAESQALRSWSVRKLTVNC